MIKIIFSYCIIISSFSYGQDTISKFFFNVSLGSNDAINISDFDNVHYEIAIHQQENEHGLYALFGIEVKLHKRLSISADLQYRNLNGKNTRNDLENYFYEYNYQIKSHAGGGHKSLTGGISTFISFNKILLRPKFSIGRQRSMFGRSKYLLNKKLTNYFTEYEITNKETPKLFLNLDFDVSHSKIDFFYINIGVGYGTASNEFTIVSTTHDNIETINYYESTYSQIYFNLSLKARLGVAKLKTY